jgi:hypothetical protein
MHERMDMPIPHDAASSTLGQADFYLNKTVMATEWWLEDCIFPNLHWARLRVFSDGTADVTFCEGGIRYGFVNQEGAGSFLSEDEYTRFVDLDADDEQAYGILFTALTPPQWSDDDHQPFRYIGTY